MKKRYDKKIEVTCIVCGITKMMRKRYGHDGKQQYCSHACLVAKQKKEGQCQQICDRCGKVEMKCNWDVQRFCSRECYDADRYKDTLKERLLEKTHITDGCWLWTGSKNKKGYGGIGAMDRKKLLTHRASWIIHYGQIPPGKQVLHTCDNTSCIKPAHLFLGTNSDNRQDMVNKKRQMHKLSPRDIINIKKLIKTTTITYSKIAEMFDVCRSTIDRINNGKTKRYRDIK